MALALGAGSAAVRVDVAQLEQVLLSLVVNAREAMGERGLLFVRSGVGACGVWVAVEDDGPGIPDALRDRVFEPFFTTRPHGIGLGLPISRDLIGQFGGRLELDAGSGVGACVRVVLPARPEAEVVDLDTNANLVATEPLGAGQLVIEEVEADIAGELRVVEVDAAAVVELHDAAVAIA